MDSERDRYVLGIVLRFSISRCEKKREQPCAENTVELWCLLVRSGAKVLFKSCLQQRLETSPTSPHLLGTVRESIRGYLASDKQSLQRDDSPFIQKKKFHWSGPTQVVMFILDAIGCQIVSPVPGVEYLPWSCQSGMTKELSKQYRQSPTLLVANYNLMVSLYCWRHRTLLLQDI